MAAIARVDHVAPIAGNDSLRDSDRWSVVWTRGEGCRGLAEMLATGDAVFGGSDPHAICIEARADLIVQRRLSSFDLVDVAVPRRFQPDGFGSVTALAGGPHSELVARVGRRIGVASDTQVDLVGVSRTRDDERATRDNLEHMIDLVPGLTPVVVRSESAASLLETLDPDALLVMGAPGSSWWQRQMFGPRRQLKRAPSGGLVMVRSTPARCFRWARMGVVLSPWLHARDALALMDEVVAPVVDNGLLVGIVRRHDLEAARDDAEVGSVAEDPVSVSVDEPMTAVRELTTFLDGGPVPVVDPGGRYRGSIARSAPAIG